MPEELRNNITVIVTDTPAVNRSAAKIIEEKFPHIMWLPCMTHCLNLFFKDTVIFPPVASLYAGAKEVVHHFYARSFPRGLLRQQLQTNEMKVKGVKSVCELRFGNILAVMYRLQRCMSAIQTVIVSDKHKDWLKGLSARDRKSVQQVADTCLNVSFWTGIDAYITALSPAYTLLREIDGSKLMMGKVWVQMSALQHHFQGVRDPFWQEFSLEQAFVARWDKSHSHFHAAGMIVNFSLVAAIFTLVVDLGYVLDPMFVGHEQHSVPQVMEGFNEVLKLLTHHDKQIQLRVLNQLTQYKDLTGRFSDELAQAAMNTLPAYKWWELFGSSTPDLARIAIQVLSQVCCASSAEQSWAEYEYIHSKRRNRLSPQKASDLLFVSANLRLLKKIASVNHKTPLDAVDPDLYEESVTSDDMNFDLVYVSDYECELSSEEIVGE
jgi:hypothetical protein